MLPSLCSRLPALLAAAIAAGFAFASPAAAGFSPTAAWGVDAHPAVLEFTAEFGQALELADAGFDTIVSSWEFAAPVQLAHAGQLSPKDNCHRHKAAGERHWHVEHTQNRGGPCVKVDGKPYRLTNHALCAEARARLVEAKNSWNGDYKHTAEALKDCIVALPAQSR